MHGQLEQLEPNELERYELREQPAYRFDADRREFVQVLGAGLVIAVSAANAHAQRGRGRGRGRGGRDDEAGPEPLSRRFHIDAEGTVTVFTSKVEAGQGSRTQLSQAAAEELHVPIDNIRLVMADTELCPDDGGTAGSRTTPATVPQVRRSAAAAHEVLIDLAAERLKVDRATVTLEDGAFRSKSFDKKLTLAELAADESLPSQLEAKTPKDVEVSRVSEWRVLGTSVPKRTGREVVTGAHKYPCDVVRTNMAYGKVLRAPTIGATLKSVDLSPAEQMDGVKAIRDGDFVGRAAPTTYAARKALDAIAQTAEWDSGKDLPSSDDLFDHFKKTATTEGRGWPQPRSDDWGDGAAALDKVAKKFEASYKIAYIAHAPMEPRSAVAEWQDGKLTVWCGSQQPGRVHGELREAFRLAGDKVRVIVPDTGGGFGGKHSGEAAVEAARLAKAAGRPVSLLWTREEEFAHAYCRPAGLIEIAAGLDDSGRLTAWDFTNYNSGESSIGSPYDIPHGRTRFLGAESPLRQGSYRALASTANSFARESAMDELAELAGADPLDFRLAHLEDGRLKDVLKAAAEKFDWKTRRNNKEENRGVGLACSLDKGSVVAACAEVEAADGKLKVLRVCQAFECGAIQNPGNLRAQVEGAIVMGLGGALREEMKFENNKLQTTNFSDYEVPRMSDVPELEIVLVNRPDMQSVGAGETPIIAVAPAVANALYHATGKRSRSMPLRVESA